MFHLKLILIISWQQEETLPVRPHFSLSVLEDPDPASYSLQRSFLFDFEILADLTVWMFSLSQ